MQKHIKLWLLNDRLFKFLSVLATLIEILQIIPFFKRFFDFQDLIANFIGAMVGVISNKLFSIQTNNKLF